MYGWTHDDSIYHDSIASSGKKVLQSLFKNKNDEAFGPRYENYAVKLICRPNDIITTRKQ